MNEKNSVEFLLYSYFKIDLNATKEKTIKSAIEKAYTDATNQGAYNTKLKTASEKEKSAFAKYDAEKLIDIFIEKSLYESDYDKLHNDTCKDLLNCYLGLPFTYGNAQKWINMTMKNLYVISLLIYNNKTMCDENIHFYKDIIKISPNFHVPIDSFIIEKIWNTEILLPIIEEKLLKNGNKGVYTSDKVIGWSKWNEEQYKQCQKSLREYIKTNFVNTTPIEWESSAWIEIAKRRSKK